MTIATPERYAEMLDTARRGGYAYPAINVTSTQTLNAALQGFAEAESDGIIQVSVGGSAYFSGQSVNDRVVGSLAFAAFAHEVAARYPNITVALHTDHCAKQYLDEWVRPLLAHEAEQVKRGEEPTFQSHMWDGSTVPLEENLDIASELLEKSVKAHTVLEIEIGAVGGEEDGHSAEINENCIPPRPTACAWRNGSAWASTADTWPRSRSATCMARTSRASSSCVRDCCTTSRRKCGMRRMTGDWAVPNRRMSLLCPCRICRKASPFPLVFHGGSGSTAAEIAEAVSYGVVKMNIDTDTQYAFSRAIAGHIVPANYRFRF